MSDSPNLDRLKAAVTPLARLIAEPQPGFITWHLVLADAMRKAWVVLNELHPDGPQSPPRPPPEPTPERPRYGNRAYVRERLIERVGVWYDAMVAEGPCSEDGEYRRAEIEGAIVAYEGEESAPLYTVRFKDIVEEEL